MHEAYLREESPAARDSMAQILINSRMCATGHRPICQDTGIVTVFVRVGMDVRWDGATMSVDDMINEGVRRAYNLPENVLRASILADPAGARKNTKDNTPAVIHYSIVPGDKVEVDVAAKGGGSENKSKMAMLNPSDSIVDWVLKTVPTMGAGWCPPGMLGIGIGGTAEKAAVMAKEVLMDPIDIHELKARGPQRPHRGTAPGAVREGQPAGHRCPGPGQPDHRARRQDHGLPDPRRLAAGVHDPNCAATRHAHFVLDGSGPAELEAPSLDAYPEIVWEAGPSARRVDLDKITPEEVQSWKPGETLLLNGKMLTGRDAAHKRMVDMLNKGETLPVDLKGRFIYYVGPVDPVGDEVVGPAGPTTATRMDKFTRQILEQTGLLGMIGKSERGPIAIEAIKDNKAVYLMAVGGAAYLVAQAIKKSKVLAFAELGMEAIYEFEVKDMPVTVAVDTNGESVHITGPAVWQKKIAESLAIEVK